MSEDNRPYVSMHQQDSDRIRGNPVVLDDVMRLMPVFCGHCKFYDHSGGTSPVCPEDDRLRYVYRDQCGWSCIGDVSVGNVTLARLTIGGVEYRRDDQEGINRAIACLSGGQSETD